MGEGEGCCCGKGREVRGGEGKGRGGEGKGREGEVRESERADGCREGRIHR